MAERETAPIPYDGIEGLRLTSWKYVRDVWQSSEDTPETKEKLTPHGYTTWEKWRQIMVDRLQLDELEWYECSLTDPASSVPDFYGGPFQYWQRDYYGGEHEATFRDMLRRTEKDIATDPEFDFARFQQSEAQVDLIGLIQRGRIIVMDGMHRATMIAHAAENGVPIKAPVKLHLAEAKKDHFETFL